MDGWMSRWVVRMCGLDGWDERDERMDGRDRMAG